MIPATSEPKQPPPIRIPGADSAHHDEALLDQALTETFPASDPISPAYEARMEAAAERRGGRGRRSARRLVAIAPLLVAVALVWTVLRRSAVR